MAYYAPDVVVFDLLPPLQFVGAAHYRQNWAETDKELTGHAYVFCYTAIALKPRSRPRGILATTDSRRSGCTPGPGVEAARPFPVARVARVYGNSHGSDRYGGLGRSGKVGWVVAQQTSRRRRKTDPGLPQPRHGWAGGDGPRSRRINRAGFPLREV
jgi:hypothetical protein